MFSDKMQNNLKETSNGVIIRDRLINISDRLRIANLHKKELTFKFVIIGDFGVGE